jgi:predicted metal-dependent hydrolase
VTLPLPLRNRLADLILDSFHDVEARKGLEALAAVCADPGALTGRDCPTAFPADLFDRRGEGLTLKSGWKEHASEFGERATRAWRTIGARPLDPADAPLAAALAAGAALFDAGLYFEVHEALEPYWMRSAGDEREALQGLIQLAVGFQHLVNGNLSGARALLRDGCAKILGRRLEGLDLDPFARAIQRCLDQVLAQRSDAQARFDWSSVPRFPRVNRPSPQPSPQRGEGDETPSAQSGEAPQNSSPREGERAG